MRGDETTDVLIVGAGICGLLAAAGFATAGKRVLVVDKGRSAGGRLATRRIGPGRADHGAQFFTTRDAAFGARVAAWQAEGLVYPWSTGWSAGSLDTAPPDGHVRYAVAGGMNQLARRLAADFQQAGGELLTGTRITRVEQDGASWRAIDDTGRKFRARAVVLTAPVPQAVALLAAGGVRLAPTQQADLEAVRYAPCLCGLFQVDGAVDLPEPGALQRQDGIVRWLADNRRKGISPAAAIVTLHASPEWSAAHYDDPDEELLPVLEAELRPWLEAGAAVISAEVKRWRYALPTVLYPARYLLAEGLPPLFFGGDAFGSPRVEGAALSGIAIGVEGVGV
jgi:hypothetical protein